MRRQWGKGWDLPLLWTRGPSPAQRMEQRDQTICLDCSGRGCSACHGTGRVCPTCGGMRYLRVAWDRTRPNSSVRKPEEMCRDCSRAGRYDLGIENATILRFRTGPAPK